MLLRSLLLPPCLAFVATAAAAQGVLVTLLDGEATLTEGARRGAAAAGVKVAPGTLVDTSAGTAVLRLEYPDNTAVDLGPGTRVMVQPPAARGGRAVALYVLRGWVKVGTAGKDPAGAVQTPSVELQPFSGQAVLAIGKPDTVFAETGALDIVERTSSRRVAVPAGALYAGAGRIDPRPPAAWLAGVPRAFRDPLPRRADTLKGRAATAAALPAPTYAQLADWLQAEPALRKDFPARFGTLAQDPAFRRELQSHLASHPEWNPVLHPPERKPTSTTP